MVTVLVCPDGAADPLGVGPTCLEAAATPTLDRLLTTGVLQRVDTIPDGLPVGTEVGLPALLGATLDTPLPRGLIEAAAAGIEVRPEEGAWRLDLAPATGPAYGTTAALNAAVRPLGGRVHHLAGHRFLLTGPAAWGDAPAGPHQADGGWSPVDAGAFAEVATAASAAVAAQGSSAWPWGRLAAGELPQVPALLQRPVTVVTAGGAPAGIARLLGCDVAPEPATAGADVIAAAPREAVVVVHDPEPDDAGHARDRNRKIAAIERFDRAVLDPVVAVLERRGGRLVVSPDHGCDPRTGRHCGGPVPAVLWATGGVPDGNPPRMTERDAAGLAPIPAINLLRDQILLAKAAA